MIYKVIDIKADRVMCQTKNKSQANEAKWELEYKNPYSFYNILEFNEPKDLPTKKEFKTLLVDGDFARFKLEQALNDGWIIVQTNETKKFIIYVLKKEI